MLPCCPSCFELRSSPPPLCLPLHAPKGHFPSPLAQRALPFISCTLSSCTSCDHKSVLAWHIRTVLQPKQAVMRLWRRFPSLRQLGDSKHSTLPGMLLARLRQASINLCGFHGRVTKFSLRVPLHSSERIIVQRSESIALSTFYSLVVRAERVRWISHVLMSVISSLRLLDCNGC